MAAIEESTYIITAIFTDDSGVAMTPLTLTWSLTDLDGTIINSRNKVTATVATSYDVVLSGDDLALSAGDSGNRRLLMEGTYTSSAGTGLPFRKTYQFAIENLVGVT